jgi:hypothetical protein
MKMNKGIFSAANAQPTMEMYGENFVDEYDELIITMPSADEIQAHMLRQAYKKLDEVIDDLNYMEMVHLINAEENIVNLRMNNEHDEMIRLAEDKISRIQREIDHLIKKRNAIVRRIERLEEPKNRCIECGLDMGIDNPRQYCGKTHCDSL